MSDPLNVLTRAQKEYDAPDSPGSVGWTRPQRLQIADESNPLPLDCGRSLWPVTVEFETYGRLNEKRDNAILILHALSGDAHVAGWDAQAEQDGRHWRVGRPGWWDTMVGPGKAFDTNLYFVICSNVLGSCYGTTGPSSTDPETGKPYGLRFPVTTVGDWVRLQERLVTYLGIRRLLAVAGGSLGGQQAIEWALAYPDRVRSAVVLAASPRLSAQGVAFNAVGRRAITTDPNFRSGDYYDDDPPARGLGVARMIGHITYLSEVSMGRKFGRRLKNGDVPSFNLDPEFEVESYLRHQGKAFSERFDANSYIYISKAMDYFDASVWGGGDLVESAARSECAWLVVSFSSDWLYTPAQCKEWVDALSANRLEVTYANIQSSYGHDAFLLEVDAVGHMVRSFVGGVARRAGIRLG
ncbi:MAG: homoserine O-acetyltransferase [Firmicutes bacterium]|nr:homoserine O-acetyltransferase [Bacillota bacterium]